MNDHRAFHKETNHIVRNLRHTIGQSIHQRRKENGLTLQKLAKDSLLSPDIIDRIELGKGEINLIHLTRLAIALRVDLLSILGSGLNS